jgi:DNA-binding MarR family transcriptional regulator
MDKYLTLRNIQEINRMSQIKIFFEKGYGFELLMLLWEDYNKKPSLSIEKTIDKLSLHKPRRETFSRFVNRLEANGCIVKSIHSEKKSMRSLSLTDELYELLPDITPHQP